MGTTKKQPTADHTFANVKAEIDQYVAYWKSRLGLEHWDFRMVYVPTANDKNPLTLARVSPSWQYRVAKFEWFLPTVQEEQALARETAVLHEMVHCLIAPCIHIKLDIDLEECVVVDTAKAFLRMKYPKRSF